MIACASIHISSKRISYPWVNVNYCDSTIDLTLSLFSLWFFALIPALFAVTPRRLIIFCALSLTLHSLNLELN